MPRCGDEGAYRLGPQRPGHRASQVQWDKGGSNSYRWGMEEGKRDLAASVLDTKMTVLMLAAKSNAEGVAKVLIEAKVDLNATDLVRSFGHALRGVSSLRKPSL